MGRTNYIYQQNISYSLYFEQKFSMFYSLTNQFSATSVKINVARTFASFMGLSYHNMTANKQSFLGHVEPNYV